MSKKVIILVWGLFSFCVLTAQNQITLEDIWKKGTFYNRGVSGFIPLKDGNHYCVMEVNNKKEQIVVKYNYETGKAIDTLINTSKICQNNSIASFNISDFKFSKDENNALITNDVNYIYRHSSESMAFVLNLKTYKLTAVSDNKIMYPTFDPSGTKVAYVYKNNLYLKDLITSKTIEITNDGKKNEIINGAVDWVYEEEFSMSSGFDWNDDGSSIAYYRFDESKVSEFSMPVYENLYPENYVFKYPKAGEANSTVDVFVYNLNENKSLKMITGSQNDQYLPRIMWTKNKNLLSIQRLNRLQNKWELMLADAKTGATKTIIEENDKYYIDITDDLIFLNTDEQFIYTSEKSGYRHIYLCKLSGEQVRQLTNGNFDIAEIKGYDEKNKVVYFSSFEKTPLEKHIYKIDLTGKNKTDLTPENTNHSATFNSTFTYFLHNQSSINSPSLVTICNNKGKTIRILENNDALQKKLAEYKFSKAVFGKLPNGTGELLNYWIIKPLDFDSFKTYPLLMFVYGGPGSQQVTNGWGGANFMWHQMLANRYGYIIACVDNRGTGARGAEFKKITYRQLGKYESDDQIAAAEYFGKLNFIDKKRIGIWGWSYGGYMSSICITKGADVFKTAIAVAPVTNWRFYDNIYTERYMQLPKDNPEGYDNNSPINMAGKLKGNYLIIHGTADDNVHFQNSVAMVEKLVENNKQFKSAYYPNKNHGIYGGNTRLHLFTLMTNFILENL
ncbi:MAG: S9 family peptidase [Bacteroidetes bacterium]|nr:S9 family peptidase [Bacteroidota bacterium]